MDTNHKGDIAESNTMAKFIEMGYTVSTPINDHSRYDVVVDIDDSLHKVQIKYASLDEDHCIKASLSSSNPTTSGSIDKKYSENEIDAYAIYCPQTDDVYWVDYKDAPETVMHLRVEDESKHHKVNKAEDYVL